MDNDDIIDDYLSGKEIDPLDYDRYQVERLKDFTGYNDYNADSSLPNTDDDDDREDDDGYGDFDEDGYYIADSDDD